MRGPPRSASVRRFSASTQASARSPSISSSQRYGSSSGAEGVGRGSSMAESRSQKARNQIMSALSGILGSDFWFLERDDARLAGAGRKSRILAEGAGRDGRGGGILH